MEENKTMKIMYWKVDTYNTSSSTTSSVSDIATQFLNEITDTSVTRTFLIF